MSRNNCPDIRRVGGHTSREAVKAGRSAGAAVKYEESVTTLYDVREIRDLCV